MNTRAASHFSSSCFSLYSITIFSLRFGRNLEVTGLGKAKAEQISSPENKEGEADSLPEQIVKSSGAIPSVITFLSFF